MNKNLLVSEVNHHRALLEIYTESMVDARDLYRHYCRELGSVDHLKIDGLKDTMLKGCARNRNRMRQLAAKVRYHLRMIADYRELLAG